MFLGGKEKSRTLRRSISLQRDNPRTWIVGDRSLCDLHTPAAPIYAVPSPDPARVRVSPLVTQDLPYRQESLQLMNTEEINQREVLQGVRIFPNRVLEADQLRWVISYSYFQGPQFPDGETTRLSFVLAPRPTARPNYGGYGNLLARPHWVLEPLHDIMAVSFFLVSRLAPLLELIPTFRSTLLSLRTSH